MNSAIRARKFSRIFHFVGKYYKQRSFSKAELAIPTVAKHKQEIRFAYFRYADDWILFTTGNKTLFAGVWAKPLPRPKAEGFRKAEGLGRGLGFASA